MSNPINLKHTHIDIRVQILIFFIVGFLGYILEVVACSIPQKKLVQRGFLRLPVLPIYSFGMLICYNLLHHLLTRPILIFFLSTILIATLEYFSAFVLEKVFSEKWWDYSMRKCNLHGRICVRNCIIFGTLATLSIYALLPTLVALLSAIPPPITIILNTALISICLFDALLCSVKIIRRNMQIASDISSEEFQTIANKILTHPAYQETRQFVQHGSTSVFEHSISVARRSYLFAKSLNLKLDYSAMIRGALLHDFCGYDWHDKKNRAKLHGFKHPNLAYKNALKHFKLNKCEKDVIKKHMWPLTLPLPLKRESFIVAIVDIVCAVDEVRAKKNSAPIKNNNPIP